MVLELPLKEIAHPNTHNQQLGQDSHDHQEVMAQTIISQDNYPHPQLGWLPHQKKWAPQNTYCLQIWF